MAEENTEADTEKMHAPSFKLLVATPMAAIMLSGKSNSEWSDLLESISPVYASAAEKTQGEVTDALLTVSTILQDGDAQVRKYFENDDLTFEGLMEMSATGADVWMCKLSDGDINKGNVVRLFKAIQAGLVEAVGDLRDTNPVIDEFIQTQDKVIEHIRSLN